MLELGKLSHNGMMLLPDDGVKVGGCIVGDMMNVV